MVRQTQWDLYSYPFSRMLPSNNQCRRFRHIWRGIPGDFYSPDIPPFGRFAKAEYACNIAVMGGDLRERSGSLVVRVVHR